MDIAYEKTCLNVARNRAAEINKTPATDRQIQSILFFMNKTGKPCRDIGLSVYDDGAFLTKTKANFIISELAEEAICGRDAS